MGKKKITPFERDRLIELAAADADIRVSNMREFADRANALGLSTRTFQKYRCWRIGAEGIPKFVETKSKATLAYRKKRGFARFLTRQCNKVKGKVLYAHLVRRYPNPWLGKSVTLCRLCEITGWPENKARAALKKAKALGITRREYVNRRLFDLSDARLAEYSEVKKLRRQQEGIFSDFYTKVVCERTGWSFEEARADMDHEKARGVSHLKYLEKEFWLKSEKNKKRTISIIRAANERSAEESRQYRAKIAEETGWSLGQVELEVAKTKLVCQCGFEDFLVCRLWEKTPDEQREYVTYGVFSKMRARFNQHTVARKILDNKVRFAELFSDKFGRVWFSNRGITYEEFLGKIEGLDRVIVKPLFAAMGKGIVTRACNESPEKNRELYDELIAMPPAIVEQYIVQHPAPMEFCPTSVNTVRIATLCHEGECKFLYSVFRMGRGAAVDNFHAGGIAAAVDLETGTVFTDAMDLEGNVFAEHPMTGKVIKGFQIPFWPELLDICRDIADRVPETKLVGWDFAITPDGPDLIEGNPGVSYVLAQIPYAREGIGLMDQMVRPYLDKEVSY